MPNNHDREWTLWSTELWSTTLRHALLALLVQAGEPLTIGDLIARLEARGYTVRGYSPKTVADALGHEVARGRVQRVRRGTYAVGRLARTTRQRVLHRYGGPQLST